MTSKEILLIATALDWFFGLSVFLLPVISRVHDCSVVEVKIWLGLKPITMSCPCSRCMYFPSFMIENC